MNTDADDANEARHLEKMRIAGLYHAIFNDDKRGQAVLEDLIRKFAKGPARGFTQDAITETFVRAHQREIFDYIDVMVTLADRGDDSPTTERRTDEHP